MDWIFENLGKLAPLVIFLLYMISSLKGRKEEEVEEDPEAAERARRIQEEIRRKILERQRGQSPSQSEARPVSQEIWEPEAEEPSPFKPISVPPREEASPQALGRKEPEARRGIEAASAFPADPYLRKRKEVEAKLKAAKLAREEAKREVASIRKRSGTSKVERSRSASGSEVRTQLLKGLETRTSLKTAVLLREVLDKPVGMR